MEPSLRVSLKGLKRTRDAREFYTSSAPYDEGKSLRLVVMELMGFDDQGANTLCPSLDLLSLLLNRRRVVPLYTWVDACRFTDSEAGS